MLYDHFLSRLLAAEDLGVLIRRKDFDAAGRLGRELADELWLIVHDLGWGDGDGQPVRLTAPPEDLHRLFSQLQRQARLQEQAEVEERTESNSLWRQTQVMNEVCDRVLAAVEPDATATLLTERTPQR